MYILAPSILAADFNILGQQIKETEEAGAKYLHIDVMDGVFVPSISFGMPLISSIRESSGQFFDVHLMIVDPIRYIKEFADCGADSITFHLEACEDADDVIAVLNVAKFARGTFEDTESAMRAAAEKPYFVLIFDFQAKGGLLLNEWRITL